MRSIMLQLNACIGNHEKLALYRNSYLEKVPWVEEA